MIKGIAFAFAAGAGLIAHISISYLVYHLLMLITGLDFLSGLGGVAYFLFFIVALGAFFSDEFNKKEQK